MLKFPTRINHWYHLIPQDSIRSLPRCNYNTKTNSDLTEQPVYDIQIGNYNMNNKKKILNAVNYTKKNIFQLMIIRTYF